MSGCSAGPQWRPASGWRESSQSRWWIWLMVRANWKCSWMSPVTASSWWRTRSTLRCRRPRGASWIGAPCRWWSPSRTDLDSSPRGTGGIHRRAAASGNRLPGAVRMSGARLIRISGSLAEAQPMTGAALYELARVGHRGLLGEVIRVQGDIATLQVYEETTGLETGEPVSPTGNALTVTLGPGLLSTILDGVGRPLGRIAERSGDFIQPGASAETLDPAILWSFTPLAKPGDAVGPRRRARDRPGTTRDRASRDDAAGPVGCA